MFNKNCIFKFVDVFLKLFVCVIAMFCFPKNYIKNKDV